MHFFQTFIYCRLLYALWFFFNACMLQLEIISYLTTPPLMNVHCVQVLHFCAMKPLLHISVCSLLDSFKWNWGLWGYNVDIWNSGPRVPSCFPAWLYQFTFPLVGLTAPTHIVCSSPAPSAYPWRYVFWFLTQALEHFQFTSSRCRGLLLSANWLLPLLWSRIHPRAVSL